MADADLALWSRALPRVNYLPPSMHLLREVSGVEDWSKYEQHVCAEENCRGHLFPKLDRASWAINKDIKCPYCETLRFKITSLGGE